MDSNFYQPPHYKHFLSYPLGHPEYSEKMTQLVGEGKVHLSNNFQRPQQHDFLSELRNVDMMINELQDKTHIYQKQFEFLEFQYNQGQPSSGLVERYNDIIRQNLFYQSQKEHLEKRKSFLLKLMSNNTLQVAQNDKHAAMLQLHPHLLTPPLTPQSPDPAACKCPLAIDIPVAKSKFKMEQKLNVYDLKAKKEKSLRLDVIDLITDDEDEKEDIRSKKIVSKCRGSTNDETSGSAFQSLNPDISTRVDQLVDEYCEKHFAELIELPDVMEVVSEEVAFGSAEFDRILEREASKIEKQKTTNMETARNEVKKEEDTGDNREIDETSETEESINDTATNFTSDENLHVELYEEVESSHKTTNCFSNASDTNAIHTNGSSLLEKADESNLNSTSESEDSDSSVGLPAVAGFKSAYTKKHYSKHLSIKKSKSENNSGTGREKMMGDNDSSLNQFQKSREKSSSVNPKEKDLFHHRLQPLSSLSSTLETNSKTDTANSKSYTRQKSSSLEDNLPTFNDDTSDQTYSFNNNTEVRLKSNLHQNFRTKESISSVEKNSTKTSNKQVQRLTKTDIVESKGNSRQIFMSALKDSASDEKEVSKKPFKMSDDQRMFVAEKILKERRMRNNKKKRKLSNKLKIPTSPVAKKVSGLSFECYTMCGSSSSRSENDNQPQNPIKPTSLAENNKNISARKDFNRNFLSLFDEFYSND